MGAALATARLALGVTSGSTVMVMVVVLNRNVSDGVAYLILRGSMRLC